MGTGKSTTGKILAKILGYKFIDIDKIVENIIGKNIYSIFQHYGESYFRKIEQKTIYNLSTTNNTVVALGGGAVVYEDNITIIKSKGILVTLIATPQEIYKRLKVSKINRPLLDTQDVYKYIEYTLQKRAYYYIMGDYIIDTVNKSLKNVALEIKNLLDSYNERN